MVWDMVLEDMLVEGEEDAAYRSHLTAHTIGFQMMYYVSIALGGILTFEQVFGGKKIECFSPTWKEPGLALNDYCWEKGIFIRNESMPAHGALPTIPLGDSSWLLQTYIYYFVRAFVFLLPHMIWNLKYRPYLLAVIRATEGMVKDLERMWLKYSETITAEYQDLRDVMQDGDSPDTHPSKAYRAVCATTRDVCAVTCQQVPLYTKLWTYVKLRMLYEVLFLVVFAALDVSLFLICNHYDTTDFYCPQPTGPPLRCVVPMLQFQWHASILAALSVLFTLVMILGHSLWMLTYMLSSSTNECFLELLPRVQDIYRLTWSKREHRKTYKLLSLFFLDNRCIIQPLYFMRAFVQNLQNEPAIASTSSANMEMTSPGSRYTDTEVWQRQRLVQS